MPESFFEAEDDRYLAELRTKTFSEVVSFRDEYLRRSSEYKINALEWAKWDEFCTDRFVLFFFHQKTKNKKIYMYTLCCHYKKKLYRGKSIEIDGLKYVCNHIHPGQIVQRREEDRYCEHGWIRHSEYFDDVYSYISCYNHNNYERFGFLFQRMEMKEVRCTSTGVISELVFAPRENYYGTEHKGDIVFYLKSL